MSDRMLLFAVQEYFMLKDMIIAREMLDTIKEKCPDKIEAIWDWYCDKYDERG